MKKFIIILVVFFLILTLSLVASRSLAKKTGEELMQPVKDELHLVSCRPSILFFKNGRPISKRTGIGWKVAYNTDKYFITHDIEVYTSLTGKIVATNPVDLKTRIDNRTK